MKALHNSCNTVTRGLPDVSTLSPQVCISGRPLVPVLQLLNVYVYIYIHILTEIAYVDRGIANTKFSHISYIM